MPVHLVAFHDNVDGGGVEDALPPVADPSALLNINGDNLIVPADTPQVVGALACLDSTIPRVRARLDSPTIIRDHGRFYLRHINPGIEPGSPPAWNDFRARPLVLKGGDNLQAIHVADPAAAARQSILLWLADGPVQPVDPAGGWWVRATTTAAALTAGAWNNRALTLEAGTNLQSGTYEVLGMQVYSTGIVAARLATAGSAHRPGVVAHDNHADVPHRVFEVPGQMGVLGKFNTDNLPSIDVFSVSADNEAQDVMLYVRRVSG